MRSTSYSNAHHCTEKQRKLKSCSINLGVPIQSLTILICAWTLAHGISAVGDWETTGIQGIDHGKIHVSSPEVQIGALFNSWFCIGHWFQNSFQLPRKKDPESFMSGKQAKWPLRRIRLFGGDWTCKIRIDLFRGLLVDFSNITGEFPTAPDLLPLWSRHGLSFHSGCSVFCAGLWPPGIAAWEICGMWLLRNRNKGRSKKDGTQQLPFQLNFGCTFFDSW